MDSLTQIVLGASIAEASLGKKIGNKAIVLGAIAGTIPDLDIITRFFVDDLSASVMHRGFSHSLIFPFLAAPILAWISKKIYSRYSDVSFKDWFKMFFFNFYFHSWVFFKQKNSKITNFQCFVLNFRATPAIPWFRGVLVGSHASFMNNA